MLKIVIGLIVVIIIIAVLSDTSNQEKTVPASTIPELAEIPLAPLELPNTRKFKLGFTYQPHDWSEDAFNEAYSFAKQNGDVISIYMDEGVPWEEAYYDKSFPETYQNELDKRVAGSKGHPVVLTLNVLAVDRKSPVASWGEDNGLNFQTPELPGIFKGKTFSSPEIIDAYFKYCVRVIEMFQPDYFFYAGESNYSFEGIDTPEFQSFLTFSKEIYQRLKSRYPDLPISQEFVLVSPEKMKTKWEMTSALAEQSDLFGVSSYPYVLEASNTKGDASKLPSNWFSQVPERYPDKPIAVLETGFNALGFSYWGNIIQGNESSQDYYMRFMLAEAQRLDFELAIWWVYRDYDELWKLMAANGVDEAFAQWRSTGVLNGQGEKRLSFSTWQAWRVLPYEQ